MIDAYSHFQFVAENREAFVASVKTVIAAAFSPLGAFISIPFGIAFLLLDARSRRHPAVKELGESPRLSLAHIDDPTTQTHAEGRFPIKCDFDSRGIIGNTPEHAALSLAGNQPFGTVAMLAVLVNDDQSPHSIQARLRYFEDNRTSAKVRTILNPVWIANPANIVSLLPMESAYLVLAVENLNEPKRWFTFEDFRLTAHANLGLEPRDITGKIQICIDITVDDTRSKTFNFSINFKTFSLVRKPKTATDLTPDPKKV